MIPRRCGRQMRSLTPSTRWKLSSLPAMRSLSSSLPKSVPEKDDVETNIPEPRAMAAQEVPIVATEDRPDSAMIFELIWEKLVNTLGEENLVFPKDIMWLSGAPGSGKGVLTGFIQHLRGITSDPITVSDLLNHPRLEAIKAQGRLIDDLEVVTVLFEELMKPQYKEGVIVDGFPRTAIQAECMKHLYDKMSDLRTRYADTDLVQKFRRPIFHVTVFYIDEQVSVERQLKRGEEVKKYNLTVQETGIGYLKALRPTDTDPSLARKRYQEFKSQVHESLAAIKKKFHFHFIDADGSLDLVKKRITSELEYQSNMELNNETFQMIRGLPLVNSITQNARFGLVKRLDTYCASNSVTFAKVIEFLGAELFPIISRQAFSGGAIIRSENPLLDEPLAVDMALDILIERGFVTILDVQKVHKPVQVNINTGEIIHKVNKVYEFNISFARPSIRRRG